MKGNKRGGISQNTLIGRQYITDNLLYLIIIFSIIHANNPFYTARCLCIIVCHHSAAHCTVRYINHFIISGSQNGVKYLYFLDRSGNSLTFNPISYLIRLEKQYDQSAGKVLQVTGQRHTDSHTGRSQQGCKRSCFDSQSTDYGDNQQNGQQNIYQTLHKSLDAYIHFSPVHQTSDKSVEHRDEEASDNEDKGCNQNAFSGTDTEIYQLLGDQRKLIQSVRIGYRFFH